MSRKQKNESRQRESTRQLIGAKAITEYSLQTYSHGELVFFIVKPSNISVLSEASLSARIYGLMTVLKGIAEIEMLCLNSRENFEDNKRFLQRRLDQEDNPAVRSLLEADLNFLDRIQVQMATAREFLIIIRLKDEKQSEVFPYLGRIEKTLREQGFTVKRAGDEDIKRMLTLTNLLDRVMPGIKKLIRSNIATRPTKYKIGDFAERYWHFDNITKMTEDEFVNDYMWWLHDKGYRNKEDRAKEIYQHALQAVTSMSSELASTKLMVQEAVRVLRAINTTVEMLQLEMRTLAATLPEYETVRAMSGVGDILAPRIIGEIGDIRRFHSGKALVAFAGIDAPPYQSGNFTGTKRHISKRGSSILRKTGYEIIQSIKTIKPTVDSSVYEFILKKEQEGKPKKVANIAGLNKFLRIYYARVLEVYAV